MTSIKVNVSTWKTILQTALAGASVAALLITLMGMVFVPRSEFKAVARMVQFNACATVLPLQTCQDAYGVTRAELLRGVVP